KWQTTGQIELFSLARFDLSDQFKIPQKLYGRDHEIKTLLDAFERVSFKRNDTRAQRQSEMMLVSGYSGIGKSVLVKEIFESLTEKKGYFISGKFDQLQRNRPYSAIIDAFRELVQRLFTENEAQLDQWKDNLLSALGQNGQIFIDIVPEIELLIGAQPPLAKLGATESQNRFNLVIQKIMRVFSKPEHPLVIFLDDLQWIDSASLKLLELIMTDRDNTALFLIGAYRDNEVEPTHPLILAISRLHKINTRINQITLKPLDFKYINQLIADTTKQELNIVHPLTELVMSKTGGNPFFVIQFLQTLYEEDLIYFVQPRLEQKGHWQWDAEKIKGLDITDNIVHLMSLKLNKMPEFSQHAIR
ncbi:MAG: AAA family ATPase, partial [Desulfobacteraceae bacterium]|nr:AAA family ATPase [Desulfobacteraceae bacterium]